ncbi:uncharacterized protein HD556DRAFT_1312945 [Suillus plorans]|uniref:Uncharacterized protein n=1 Tax=Suillus plorans TaxID=116603 RepID=A0A9P7ADN0_9AGAM|nr:uncharacterized protein HD556DRAFT_1312945 [Suillus plorans]KAG1787232.1 hypothetical protein HD556DRAFT_1312945 [Suillus plorans]
MLSDMRGYKGWNGLINFLALPLCLAFRHTSLLLPLVLEANHYVREQPIWWPRAPRAQPSRCQSGWWWGQCLLASQRHAEGRYLSGMAKRAFPKAPKSDTELVWTWWWFYWRRGMMGVGEWRLRGVICYHRAEVFQERHHSDGGHFAIMAENICRPSDMNQPVGLTTIQHHVSLLTPKALVAIFSQMQGFLPPPPPPLPVPPVPVIQQNLELLSSMQYLARRMEGIEKDPCPRWKRGKKQEIPGALKEPAYILNVTKARLGAAQPTTRPELQMLNSGCLFYLIHCIRSVCTRKFTISLDFIASEIGSDGRDDAMSDPPKMMFYFQACTYWFNAGLEYFEELDVIRYEQRKECKRTTALTRRVNLNNTNNIPPSIPTFPFMLDSNWHDSYQAENPHALIEMYEQDPRGFKKPEYQHEDNPTQGNSEKARKNSSTDSHDANGDSDGTDDGLNSDD